MITRAMYRPEKREEGKPHIWLNNHGIWMCCSPRIWAGHHDDTRSSVAIIALHLSKQTGYGLTPADAYAHFRESLQPKRVDHLSEPRHVLHEASPSDNRSPKAPALFRLTAMRRRAAAPPRRRQRARVAAVGRRPAVARPPDHPAPPAH